MASGSRPPAWVDMATLCDEICVHPNTVDNWVRKGILPPPVKRGAKLMWRWSEIDRFLAHGPGDADAAAVLQRIEDAAYRNATRGRGDG